MRYWFLLQAHEPRSDRARLMLVACDSMSPAVRLVGSPRRKMSQLCKCCQLEREKELMELRAMT